MAWFIDLGAQKPVLAQSGSEAISNSPTLTDDLKTEHWIKMLIAY